MLSNWTYWAAIDLFLLLQGHAVWELYCTKWSVEAGTAGSEWYQCALVGIICLLVRAYPSICAYWHPTLVILWQPQEWGLLLFSNEVIAWMSCAMQERPKPAICYQGMLYEWLFWASGISLVTYKCILLYSITARWNKSHKRTDPAKLACSDVNHNWHLLMPYDLCCTFLKNQVCDLFYESKMSQWML